MANNYTQASFTILCSQEQAQMALDAIAYVTDTDVAEGEHLLSKTITSWNSKRKSPVKAWQSAMMKALTSTTLSR